MTATMEPAAPPAFEIVEPSDVHRFSALLYGPEGVGKSVAAASSPGPILYLNADAKDALRFARRHFHGKEIREVRPTGLATLHNAIFYLRDHPEVQSIVVDTVGGLYDVVARDIAQDEKNITWPEIGRAQDEIEAFVRTIIEEDVNVVLVAHDMAVEAEGAEVDGTLRRERMPMCGTSKPSFPRKLMRLVSIVGFCGVDGNGDERRHVVQVEEAGGRRAKDRTGALVASFTGDTAAMVEADLSKWGELINAFYAVDPAARNTDEEGK